MRKKRGILLLGLIVILSGWWFIAINGSVAQPEEGVLDVWATWGEDSNHIQAFLDRYSQSGGLPVRVTTQVRSDDLLASLSATNPPDLVILSTVDPVESYYEMGLVEQLNERLETSAIDLDDFFLAALDPCKSSDGGYVCLPWGCDLDALFWNKDLFKAAGLDPEQPPQTLEELVEYAEKLTLRNEEGELRQAGFIPNLPHSQTELYVRMFGGAFNKDIDADLSARPQPEIDAKIWQQQVENIYLTDDLEAFMAAFTPYMASSHPVFAGKRLSCQQCHRSTPIQNNKTPDVGFYQGRVAMMIDGQWQVSLNSSSEEFPIMDYGVAPVPPSKAHLDRENTIPVQGPVVFIPAGAMDKDAAVRLLTWMTSPEILAEAADAYFMLPASQTAAQDMRFQENPALMLFIKLLAGSKAKNITSTR